MTHTKALPSPLHCSVLGSGTMGAQIAWSLALRTIMPQEQGGANTTVTLWGRSQQSLERAMERIIEAGDFMQSQGLIGQAEKQQTLDTITCTTHMPRAVAQSHFIIEAVAEDITLKQDILHQAERHAPCEAVVSSTTSAIGATDIQRALDRPQNFVVAHYIQPAHLMAVVEVVRGEHSDPQTGQWVTDLLTSCGKSPVDCPDIPGFFFARIQHAILRECVAMVQKGLMSPTDCDTLLKGYGARLPAMGAFEHADLAGIDLILSPAAQAVWQDLSNITNPKATIMGKMLSKGHTGMASGQGFYGWTNQSAADFKENRDKEIVRRAKINAGGDVTL